MPEISNFSQEFIKLARKLNKITASEITTRRWKEKLPNGDVVDVVEVLDDIFWSGGQEKVRKVRSLIKSKKRTIFLLKDYVPIHADCAKETDSIIVTDKYKDQCHESRCYTLKEALERMVR